MNKISPKQKYIVVMQQVKRFFKEHHIKTIDKYVKDFLGNCSNDFLEMGNKDLLNLTLENYLKNIDYSKIKKNEQNTQI